MILSSLTPGATRFILTFSNLKLLEELESGKSLKEIVGKIQSHVEEDVIKKVLIKTGGNKTRAANILKIDRMTLYSKLRRFGNIEMLYGFRL